ncbi:hypothetical protein [Synechococcus sp. EJ6-Ellesmere]|uniref:hypothetical protein n=1 Tax=Synechococcus sp. EJ6-Ellesmere TaxID=2823734 RepID=UPI0020CD1BA3|nr:hypothetical protein [Synechococcus sp. EJ6-Ellesmere]MCP9825042.1 hypothetical protein [Synechococcus sp. EJ6-Ellesmere]
MVAQSCGQATAIREAQRDKTPEFGRPEPLIPSKSALLRSAISSPEGENAAIQAVFPQTPSERRTGVLPRSGDSNANPTGGTRQVTYKLVPGEAMGQLEPVRSTQF